MTWPHATRAGRRSGAAPRRRANAGRRIGSRRRRRRRRPRAARRPRASQRRPRPSFAARAQADAVGRDGVEQDALEVGAVGSDHLPAQLRVGDRREKLAAGVPDLCAGDARAAHRHALVEAEPVKRRVRVRGEHEAEALVPERRRALDDERLDAWPLQRDGRGEPPDPRSDDDRAHPTLDYREGGRSAGVSTSPGAPRSSQGTRAAGSARAPLSGTASQAARPSTTGWPRSPA